MYAPPAIDNKGRIVNNILQRLRSVVRFSVAVLFWLHGLFLLYFPAPPLARWAHKLHLDVSEFLVIFTLALLTVLSSYGLRKFSFDIAYIYFFPFIAVYYLGRIFFSAGKAAFVALQSSQHSGGKEGPTAEAKVLEAKVVPALGPSEKPPPPVERRNIWRGFLSNVWRPFRQFALLWCLLLLLSSKLLLVWLALAVVLFQLGRVLARVAAIAVFSLKWLTGLDERIRAYLEDSLQKLASLPADAELVGDTTIIVGAALLARLAVRFFQNRKQISFGLVVLSVVFFAVVYLYLGLLFSFVYYGLARVQSVPYAWSSALVTSIFIPAAYGDLPANVWLKLVGGIHWVCVIALGTGAVLAYFQKKLDEVYGVAQLVRSRLETPEIKFKLEFFEKRIRTVPAPQQAPTKPP